MPDLLKPERLMQRQQHYDQYQDSMQDMRALSGAEGRCCPGKKFSIHPGAATVSFLSRTKATRQGKARGEPWGTTKVPAGISKPPETSNLSGVPFPAFRGLHPHQ